MPSKYADMLRIDSPFLKDRSVSLDVLRLDALFPQLSGNKYFKLKKNIEQAKLSGCKSVLSFGGAFSNHIHALAVAGQVNQLKTIGLIRGEEHSPLNPTLQDAVDAGMQLRYIGRPEYRQRNNPDYLSELQQLYPETYIIPEGGSNRLGVEGCMEIVSHIKHHCAENFDVIVVPCGTAATLAGIAAAAGNKQVWGISVLRNSGYLKDEVKRFHTEIGYSGREQQWKIFDDFHCGGYAKVTRDLIDFIDNFEVVSNISLEPVYSGKMFYGLYQLLKYSPEKFTPSMGSDQFKIVAIHTGGLQGLRGMRATLDNVRNSANC